MTKPDLFDFIHSQKLGVLGSLSPEGAPQSSLVGIAVTPDLEIIFDTVKSSRKYRNLTANPACSFSIGWSGEATLQYEGRTIEPSGDELVRYRSVYFKKWPDGPDRLSWPGITYFVVRPKWIRFCDYGQRPPLIQE